VITAPRWANTAAVNWDSSFLRPTSGHPPTGGGVDRQNAVVGVMQDHDREVTAGDLGDIAATSLAIGVPFCSGT
jgi:hypothetical protein